MMTTQGKIIPNYSQDSSIQKYRANRKEEIKKKKRKKRGDWKEGLKCSASTAKILNSLPGKRKTAISLQLAFIIFPFYTFFKEAVAKSKVIELSTLCIPPRIEFYLSSLALSFNDLRT